MPGDHPIAQVRLDIWLDVSCLFKTRSEAQRACRSGKVDVNGQPGNPHRLIKPGDQIVISRPSGRRQTVLVVGLAERSLPKPDARRLFDDRTPPTPPEEIAQRRAERAFRAAQIAAGPPDKRQRRAIRRLRGY